MVVKTRLRNLDRLLGGDLDQQLEALRELALLSREMADYLLEAERRLDWATREMETVGMLAEPSRRSRVRPSLTSGLPLEDPIPTVDLIAHLQVTRGVFAKMRKAQGFPRAVRMSGNRIGFRREEVVHWLKSRRS